MSTPQLAILFFVVPNGVFVDQKTSRCKNKKCLSCQFWFKALEEEKLLINMIGSKKYKWPELKKAFLSSDEKIFFNQLCQMF